MHSQSLVRQLLGRNAMHRRTLIVVAALTASALLVGGRATVSARQGSITIEFSNFGTGPWPAGPDFATDVLGDPWDFCNPEDVAPYPLEVVGWTNFSVNSSAHPCQAG